MNSTSHFSEEALIDFHLHESPADEPAIRRHLEACPACAELSDSIAETLRVFSAEPIPHPNLDPNLDHAWQRLRGSLPVLATAPPKRRLKLLLWPAAGLAAIAAILIAAVMLQPAILQPGAIHRSYRRAFKLPTQPTTAINGRGPLTTQPADPAVANHLDAAERLLTEVNNTSGPLDPATRRQAHNLLLSNALYVSSARTHGDLAEAAVLEDLGRVLTTVDNEPSRPHSTLSLRLEMNTSGLLLDIRILRQNDQVSQ